MKKLVLFASMLWALTFFASAADPVSQSLTLKECYALALVRSETVAIQKELIRETEGEMMVALSTALPKVGYGYSQKWQDVEEKRGEYYDPESRFTIVQPLFTGFKELAAVRGSKHAGRQREAELKRAQQFLFLDVAEAFYLDLSFQQYEEVLQETLKNLQERLAELNRRVTIGKSRPSEVASAEAKLRRTEAALEGARSQRAVAGQLLEFLIGQPVERLVSEDLPAEDRSLEELAMRVKSRPDVIATWESYGVYKSNVTSARSGLLPSVDAVANSYTKRADDSEDNDWDATLRVSVPIFNGLTDWGLLKKARSQLSQADLQTSLVERQALLEIRNAYSKWQYALRKSDSLDRAVAAFEKNYELQVVDFKNSLVNNLDVLQALEDLQEVRRDSIIAWAEYSRNYWALRVATGDIP